MNIYKWNTDVPMTCFEHHDTNFHLFLTENGDTSECIPNFKIILCKRIMFVCNLT